MSNIVALPKSLNSNDIEFNNGKAKLLVKNPTIQQKKDFIQFKQDIEADNKISIDGPSIK